MKEIIKSSPINVLKQCLVDTEIYWTEPSINTFLNPFSYLLFRKQLDLFSNFSIRLDGIALVHTLNVFGFSVKRMSFDMTSMAPIVLKKCVEDQKSIYFIGASEQDIQAFVKIIKANYPKLDVIGFRNGFFRNGEEREKTIKSIFKVDPDVVIVGMGTPLQEIFLFDLRQEGWMGTGFTCGGFFHQTTEALEYYPKYINLLNLRWLFRMLREPKLIKRYFLFYPKSLALCIFDLCKSRSNLTKP